MRKFTAYAFVAALLAAGFAIPASAEGDCGAKHSTKTVDISTPDNSVADSSTQQSTQPGK
ncbi:MAG TPA: hypothetical protein VF987_00235 [Rhodospirillales bacterium]|jgi:hypothetical protein